MLASFGSSVLSRSDLSHWAGLPELGAGMTYDMLHSQQHGCVCSPAESSYLSLLPVSGRSDLVGCLMMHGMATPKNTLLLAGQLCALTPPCSRMYSSEPSAMAFLWRLPTVLPRLLDRCEFYSAQAGMAFALKLRPPTWRTRAEMFFMVIGPKMAATSLLAIFYHNLSRLPCM